MARILVVDDEPDLCEILCFNLESEGFGAERAYSAESALQLMGQGERFDLVLLDVMMERMSGFEMAREMRTRGIDTPVIFLTARAAEEDQLDGFASGGDDYITKPFSMEELLARLNATMRRSFNEDRPDKNVFKIGNFTFDYAHQTLVIGDDMQRLTAKECDLLRMFAINFGQLVDRNTCLQKIWKDDSYFAARSMDVYITKLRKYLKADPSVEIVNVHGVGFKLTHKE